MRRSILARLGSLLLALVFVGGGLALPVVDALVFHGRAGSPAPREVSVSGPAAAAGHQQLCLQLSATGKSRPVPAEGAVIAPLPADVSRHAIATATAPVVSFDPTARYSRAPPSPTIGA